MQRQQLLIGAISILGIIILDPVPEIEKRVEANFAQRQAATETGSSSTIAERHFFGDFPGQLAGT
jgi:hypothetical protein